jgi:hypothetical protein
LSENLAGILGAKGEAAERMVADTRQQEKKYEEQGKEIQAEARRGEQLAEEDERRALRYDLGEGLLEIGLVLTSLYFISRKRMFPAMGLMAGVLGTAIASAGLMV